MAASDRMKSSLLTFRSPALHLCIIALLCGLCYSNTFAVPFHFDDKLNISDNALVKDLANWWPPAGNRWLGYVTFALNYRVNGLDTTGYHVVNLAVHVLAAFLVYWLVLLTLRTPYCTTSPDPFLKRLANDNFLALLDGLLFACHPVQTQAVTYIVQRFASLAALLYLLSLAAYVRARLVPAPGADRRTQMLRVSLYALSLAAAVLAMMTKENAFTLPVVVALYELSFLRNPGPSPHGFRRNIMRVLAASILILAAAAVALLTGGATNSFRATDDISRTDYLLTQFPVVATYVRLLLLPVQQSIDYDIPVYHRFLEPAVFGSFLFLTAMAAVATLLFRRSRRTRGPARLIAFGILWFFITLSVESSIIPLPDVIFEHRLYLPAAGAFLALAVVGSQAAAALTVNRPQARPFLAAAVVLLVLSLAAGTFLRNMTWRTEIGLWEDAIAKYPASYRAHTMLGGLYRTAGRREDAQQEFLRSLAIKPAYAETRVNLGNILVEEGRLDDAMREFMIALQLRSMDEIDTALLFVNIGNVYRLKNMTDREIEYYTYALNLVPGDAYVHFLLGRAYQARGMQDPARQYFARAHQLNPDRY